MRDDVTAAWAGLLEERDEAAQYLESARGDAALLPAERAGGGVSGGFLGTGAVLARAAVLLSPARAAEVAALYLPFLAQAVADVDAAGPVDDAHPRAVDVLEVANAARCCGSALPPDAGGVERAWLPALAERGASLDEFVREEVAFACVAAGLPELVARVFGAALPARVEPGRTFGPNLGGLAKYLAAAARDGAALADVEPALDDFLADFPVKLQSGTEDWPTLLWCGRAVLSTIGGMQEGQVAAEIHRRVRGERCP
jgi:hypothetical protein